MAVPPALALPDADDHPLAVDVGHLQLAELIATHPGGIERQQDSVAVKVPGRADQSSDFLAAQDDRQPLLRFRIWKLQFGICTAERLHVEEPQAGDLLHDRVRVASFRSIRCR